ncbi:DUF5710 domain-containing protein [Streptomyces beihaiensis]|uniref:DUF5710 domain-containing protein n=1 Tax=Streptomyces beihaiensis TaxID=2984495 RepID=A0ABT3U6B9_9ACTN|nr:DUF5710 domain-containing protein [Streptomyces beihaiensis]MCX3064216.1 DUF5710 domain-containing protein [Streptomyces beihaiensis]
MDVPYEEKDEAKEQLRARWDPKRRQWYVDAHRVTPGQAARWLPKKSSPMRMWQVPA